VSYAGPKKSESVVLRPGAKLSGSLQVDPTLFNLKIERVSGNNFEGQLEWLSGRIPSQVKGKFDGTNFIFQEVGDVMHELQYRGALESTNGERQFQGVYSDETRRRGTFSIKL